jgi:transcriptional regulator with XRE-family HTH domain
MTSSTQRIGPAMPGAQIRRIRLALGMSQEEFAYNAGLAAGTISKAERDKTKLSRLAEKAIKDLAIAYGVDFNGRAL